MKKQIEHTDFFDNVLTLGDVVIMYWGGTGEYKLGVIYKLTYQGSMHSRFGCRAFKIWLQYISGNQIKTKSKPNGTVIKADLDMLKNYKETHELAWICDLSDIIKSGNL